MDDTRCDTIMEREGCQCRGCYRWREAQGLPQPVVWDWRQECWTTNPEWRKRLNAAGPRPQQEKRMTDIVRVLRILEYVGTREAVERCLNGTAVPVNGVVEFNGGTIRSALIGTFPEVLQRGVPLENLLK